MPKLDIIKVFIASPGDLFEERKLFLDAIQQVNELKARGMNYFLEGIGWEDSLPGAGRPQELINEDVAECDVFVMLLWKRWGTPSSQEFSSGTEEEFTIAYERFKKTGRPYMLLYFRSVPQAMMADPGEQLRKVIEFRTKIEIERLFLYRVYDKSKQWKELFVSHLSKWLEKKVADQTITDAEMDRVQIPREIEERILALQRELEEKSAQLKTTQSKLRAESIAYAVSATKLIEEGRYTLAEEKFSKAIELYDEPEVLNSFGSFLCQIGSLSRARDVYEKLLTIAAKDEGRVYEARAWAGLGNVYATTGDFSEAERMYEKALEIDTALAHEKGVATNYINLGNIYVNRGEMDKAEEMYERAIQINKALGRNKGVASAQLSLGNLYMIKGDLGYAEEMYKSALELNSAIGRKQGIADAYTSLGCMYVKNGELNRAKIEFEKALEINTALVRKSGIANAHLNLGVIYNKQGVNQEAEWHWRESARLYAELGDNQRATKILSWITPVHPITITAPEHGYRYEDTSMGPPEGFD